MRVFVRLAVLLCVSYFACSSEIWEPCNTDYTPVSDFDKKYSASAQASPYGLWYYAKVVVGQDEKVALSNSLFALEYSQLKMLQYTFQLNVEMYLGDADIAGVSNSKSALSPTLEKIRSTYALVPLIQVPNDNYVVFSWDYSTLKISDMPLTLQFVISAENNFGSPFVSLEDMEFNIKSLIVAYQYPLLNLCSPMGVTLCGSTNPALMGSVPKRGSTCDPINDLPVSKTVLSNGQYLLNNSLNLWGDLVIDSDVEIVLADYSRTYLFSSIKIHGTLTIGTAACPISETTSITLITPQITVESGGKLQAFGSSRQRSLQATRTSYAGTHFVYLPYDSLYNSTWETGDNVLISSPSGQEEHLIRQFHKGAGVELVEPLQHTHEAWDHYYDSGTTVVLSSRNVKIGNPRDDNVYYLFQKPNSASLNDYCIPNVLDACWEIHETTTFTTCFRNPTAPVSMIIVYLMSLMHVGRCTSTHRVSPCNQCRRGLRSRRSCFHLNRRKPHPLGSGSATRISSLVVQS
eukprot:TRINITY_DN3428_c0_g2_i5.p1 TRINITY_DN3428_c0_g2~~TRINITY_DN3428_c0_g2_i5.p1  ORF type:complete len:518 (+),score=47.66 TRINITY_DN3428_c0_g2_i5:60-1613(+)